nr:hypothetical protein HK105_007562 [Polyrhizophydium stewartii]
MRGDIEDPEAERTLLDAGDAEDTGPAEGKPAVTPDKFNKLRFGGANLQTPSWVQAPGLDDGSIVLHESGLFVIAHVEHRNRTTLASSADMIDSSGQPIKFADWTLSPDLKYILLLSNREKGWRHSFFGDYWLFDVAEKHARPLVTSKSDKVIPEEIGSGRVALAAWSPAGHNVAWVRDNDLFVTVGGQTEVRITRDGSKRIINGISDWIYEEEVLGNQRALWFSPDGSRLAYLKFNETLVEDYLLQYYAKYGETPYPRQIDLKYPKPGSPNPVVTLHIATPSSAGPASLSVPIDFGEHGFEDEDRLIVEVNWVTDNDALFVRLMNRVQDVQKLLLVKGTLSGDTMAWTVSQIRNEATPDNAWFNIEPAYVELMEDARGYTHLAFFGDILDPAPTSWITSGDWEVATIAGIDSTHGIIYYLSTEQGSTERHLYSVHLDGSNKKRLTPPAGTTFASLVPSINQTLGQPVGAVGFYDATFSPACRYYLLAYLGPDVPFQELHRTDNDYSRMVADYNYYREQIAPVAVPPFLFTTIRNTVGDDMNAKIIFPVNFDPSGRTKYPVLMQVYGGPGSQTVQQRFKMDFSSKMAALGFVVAQVDGRGTGFKGRAFRSSVAKHLGLHEVEDQVAAGRWLSNQPYVDPRRIAIWGWVRINFYVKRSYGGFVAAKTIEADSGVFAVGMSVAPVVDFRFYDSIYTERYMKTPVKNPDGYAATAVHDMRGFRHSKFLLVHGTADDNVHFQNSALLTWHLVGDAVPPSQFRVQYYTDSDHGIGENGANEHIFGLLQLYVCDEFAMPCGTASAAAGIAPKPEAA